MMYLPLLASHSLVRWLVLVSLLIAVINAYRGWLSNRRYLKFDDTIRITAVTIAHIQVGIGVWLYLVSPVVDYFLHNFSHAVHERHIRFFGMEHITMMVIAIIIVTIGSSKTKRRQTDKEKFKTMAIWFTIALVIIFLSIPWAFSPFTSRPLIRLF
ncbi:hypothetical protein [Chryseosolibacter indicus]|uniref:Cytochrome B n=1 Tax=Chryseosolibacter indicus TaxID=2782351 RepID=A0ABS5VM91_9BACT|nr:hypothetical protein [Chryseosolibacter indicus]MBT1702486.1 hypothetical protein [Chryseosolibacter indicus]